MIKTIAHPNIALVKYWGKRNAELNLPAVGSISVTLDKLKSETEISFIDANEDIVYFNGEIATVKETIKFTNFINLFRNISRSNNFVKINTVNNFPTSAGLASSASGFAALTLAASTLFGLEKNFQELSQLARLGSGSASRSLFGGFAEWHKGKKDNGSDCFAEQIADENHFKLKVIVAVTSREKKKISSRNGMVNSAMTSPYYHQFVNTSEHDLAKMREAIIEKDFELMAKVTMQSTIKMHSVMMTTNPPLFYWNQSTYAIIETLHQLIEEKYPVFYTIDAGPQVKIFTIPSYEEEIIKRININQIEEIIVCNLGKGAEIIKELH
ncbi:MAG: diphosphomevalonate decarboxylase [Ignavibacteria bacterium GWF2_33_9]|nr:MAG: diphosphomevalonate decarboxylase [Ignavibacteria bacterium GWF2_33_9]